LVAFAAGFAAALVALATGLTAAFFATTALAAGFAATFFVTAFTSASLLSLL
jgi:hypothetical protein